MVPFFCIHSNPTNILAMDTFEDLLDLTPSKLRPVAVKLKEVILAIDPSAVEVVRLGERAATYGVGPKKMSQGYVYIMPHKEWINLGFYRGSSCPKELDAWMEGTGKNLRHVKHRNLEDACRPEIKSLLIWAHAERVRALGPF